jgi:hypothetical protein
LESLARDKQSILLGLFASDEEKSFVKLTPVAGSIVLFTALINPVALLARMFVTVSQFYPTSIFASKLKPTGLVLPMVLHSKGRLQALPTNLRLGGR